RKQVRKSERVVRSNLHVAKCPLCTAGDRVNPVAQTNCDPLADGSELHRKVWFPEVIKRWDRSVRMIDARVELDGPDRREEHLKARHVIQRDPKQCEPIHESIAGKCTQGPELIKTR